MLALETQARAELMSSPDGGLEQRADPAHVAELVQHVLVGSNRFALQAASEYVVCFVRVYTVLYIYSTRHYFTSGLFLSVQYFIVSYASSIASGTPAYLNELMIIIILYSIHETLYS